MLSGSSILYGAACLLSWPVPPSPPWPGPASRPSS
jgi:hypothetical protein